MPKTSLDIPEGGGGVAVTVYKDQGEHFWQVYLNTFSDCIHWKGLWYNVVVGKSILPNGWMDGWTDRWNILNEPLCLFFVFFSLTRGYSQDENYTARWTGQEAITLIKKYMKTVHSYTFSLGPSKTLHNLFFLSWNSVY